MISESLKRVIFKYMDKRFETITPRYDDDHVIRFVDGENEISPFIYDIQSKVIFTNEWPEQEIHNYFSLSIREARRLLGEWVSKKYDLNVNSVT